MAEEVMLEVDNSGKIAYMTLNRPPANALTVDFTLQIQRVVDEVEHRDDVRVVILRSANPKIFCGGADISTVEAHDVMAMDYLGKVIKDLLLSMRSSSKVYIALLQGHCLGGGLELALGCDFRIAGDGPWKLGLPEVNLGLFPGGGGVQLVGRIAGPQKAFSMAATGQPVSFQEALGMGLIDAVHPVDQAAEEAFKFAQRLANGPWLAITDIKQAVVRGLAMGLDQAFDFERQMHKHLVATEDCKEGVTAFKEKRAPRFIGR